jgi:hypothetical protein
MLSGLTSGYISVIEMARVSMMSVAFECRLADIARG